MTVHELSRADARRIAVRAQRLDQHRPADLLDVVRHLTLLQIDPTAAVAPSADLVAWSRLGSAYSREDLAAAAVVGREGRERFWDLAARVYPDDPAVPAAEALRRRNERRLHALGIARARGPECPVEPLAVRDEIDDLARWLGLEVAFPG